MILRDTLFAKHLSRQRWPVGLATAILLTHAVVIVALPLPMRFIMNHLLVPSRGPRGSWLGALLQVPPAWWLLVAAGCALAALALMAAALEVGEEYWLARAVNGIVEGCRRDLLELILSRRQPFVAGARKADIVGRLSGDAANLEAILSVGLPTLLRAVPTLGMVFAVLASLNRAFALAMLAAVLLMFLVNIRCSSEVRGYAKQSRQETNRFELDLYQTLQAFPLVKSLSMEAASFRLLAGSAGRISGHLLRSQVAESLLGSSLTATKSLMRVMILLVGGGAVLRGEMLVGDMVLFLSYVDLVASPVNELSKFAVKRAKAAVAVDRIEEFRRAAEAQPERDGVRFLPEGRTLALRLRDVSFAHPDGPVSLRNFCALLQPGDLVAVAGPSGSGKSTFLKLLNRLLDPTEGDILLGGLPLGELRLAELRRHVTAVSQETFFLAGTIRENLGIASPAPVSDAELWQALERVHARGFVAGLPLGLDTRIGEGGLRLSGGEERRLSVARAFLRPRQGVFLFDEPTSGLDPGSSDAFLSSIRGLSGEGATVLWATHRLEEVPTARRVLFFHPGHNPALGSHQELLRDSPPYAAFLNAGKTRGARRGTAGADVRRSPIPEP